MRISEEPYAGHSEEESGYHESPGIVLHFSEGQREYRFKIEDSMPRYATALPAVFDGRSVTLMVHAPHAAGSPAIQVPSSCGVFRTAIAELGYRGVEYVSFFNQPSGGYMQISIAEVTGV